MLESKYQALIIERLQAVFPDCIILKNDEQLFQGIPDLLVLNGPWWAMLEVKPSARSRHRPNQDYWVDVLDRMSFAAFIFPENEDEVFDALEHSYQACRSARVS